MFHVSIGVVNVPIRLDTQKVVDFRQLSGKV
jgi:hypothetical protein